MARTPPVFARACGPSPSHPEPPATVRGEIRGLGHLQMGARYGKEAGVAM